MHDVPSGRHRWKRWLRADRPIARPADDQVRVIRWGGGHVPGSVTVKADRPVQLVFERFDGAAAHDSVTIPALGWVSTLANCARCTVALAPLAPGSYAFSSVDGRLQGCLLVVP
jgi:plastocyanin domain-containing protein